MLRALTLLIAFTFPAAAALAQTAPKTLDIYYIDTEGGQATLFVAPGGQTVLIDTGNTGTRDPNRIIEVTQAAGVKQIDYLLITHYHGDHVGGYLELAKQIPILHYVDHGQTVQPEQVFDSRTAYDAAVKTHPHIIAKPGDKLPIAGLDWTIVSSAGKVLAAPMTGEPGAGLQNPYCADYKPKEITVDLENAQSVGSVIRYGKFRTVDLGDLLWNWEAQLACPVNKIGTVDEMLTTHHGLAWSGVPALIDALRPRVIVMNNGVRKGAAPEYLQTLESAPGLEDLWQLHWSANTLQEHNVAGVRIANIETPETVAEVITHPPGPIAAGTRPPDIGNPNHAPAYWIKVSAQANGDFTVTNTRNGFSKTYKHRG
ncbi:MAG: MBL fold metallo-hydrolase [Steroidobacteraceae bacterium]|jgi:competence protein ComEC